MVGCEYCGVETNLPFKCSYCRRKFCVDHRLPETHNCENLIFSRVKREVHGSRIRVERIEDGYAFKRRVIPNEVTELLIAWAVLGFCFSASSLGSPSMFATSFLASLLTVGLGFIAHELSHRYYARKFGCSAEFKLWPMGLFIALIFAVITQGTIIFAAPGAVYITPRISALSFGVSKREYGIISLSGPMANILVALVFLTAYLSAIPVLSSIGYLGFTVNMWLAAFNLIPFGMMDGRKIFDWSRKIWFLVAIPVWVITFIRVF